MVKKQHLDSKLPLVKVLHHQLKNNKVAEFKHIVNCLNDNSIDFLCECVRNLCDRERFENLSVKDRKKLQKIAGSHTKQLKTICKGRNNVKRKRKIIQEGSGFFLPLLSIIVPLITSLITGR